MWYEEKVSNFEIAVAKLKKTLCNIKFATLNRGSRGIIKFQHNITVETLKHDILRFYLGRFQQQVPTNQFHLALIYLCLPRRAVANVGVNEFKFIVTLNQYDDIVPTWVFVFVWCDQFHRETWGN